MPIDKVFRIISVKPNKHHKGITNIESKFDKKKSSERTLSNIFNFFQILKCQTTEDDTKFFILIVLAFKINIVPLHKQIIEAMIRSIPNPPMDREDVARFHRNLEKHLRGDFSADERHRIEERKARTESITKRIIANCGGKNPILGY